MSVRAIASNVVVTVDGARIEGLKSFVYEDRIMNSDRINVVTDLLEERGFSAAEIENVREALGSPPAWLPEGHVASISFGGDDEWRAEVVGTGSPPRLLRAMFEAGDRLQVGIRRKR